VATDDVCVWVWAWVGLSKSFKSVLYAHNKNNNTHSTIDRLTSKIATRLQGAGRREAEETRDIIIERAA